MQQLDSYSLVLLLWLFRYPYKEPEARELIKSYKNAKCEWMTAAVINTAIRSLAAHKLIAREKVKLGDGEGNLVPTTVIKITDAGTEVARQHYKAIGMSNPTLT